IEEKDSLLTYTYRRASLLTTGGKNPPFGGPGSCGTVDVVGVCHLLDGTAQAGGWVGSVVRARSMRGLTEQPNPHPCSDSDLASPRATSPPLPYCVHA